ncbi:MAG TPA: glycosyltransferase [Solirubrobacterales bacterium]|nr:glycosyltransferase [Solirubrobacterales bacterium]
MDGDAASRVSVVVPCFNQAHFLTEAVESVLRQSYREVEVTVVDDGSDDNSYEVAGRYPGVRRLRQPHRGAAAARNLGLAESGGELIVFLDADDRLLPEALKVGVESVLARPRVAFVAGTSRDIGDDGSVIREGGQSLVTQDHFLHLLEDCYIWSGSSIVYRRAAIEAVGGFDEGLEAGDDYDLYLRLAHRFPIYCHGRVVTEYRRHGTNTTRDPGVVLASQLRVLKAQRIRLRDRREAAARKRGIRKTRAVHGGALAERVSSDWRERRRRALRGIATLARHDPGGLLRLPRRTA